MKQVLSFIFLNFCFFSYAQNLNLRKSFKQNSELPQKLNKKDIGIIYEIYGGWSAYDYLNYYIIENNGDVKLYSEERPKLYLKNKKTKKTVKEIELTQDKKEKIIKLIKSKQLAELLKYNQEDFKIKVDKNSPPPCYISDVNGYKLTFIQNNKQNTYDYYAPKYMYEKCPNKTINKTMLKKFIEVMNLF